MFPAFFKTGIDEIVANDRYVHLSERLIQAIYLPAGRWAVKVRDVQGMTLGFCVPLEGTSGSSFLLLAGDDSSTVHGLTLRWAVSAQSMGAGAGADRVVFVGYADAIGERH